MYKMIAMKTFNSITKHYKKTMFLMLFSKNIPYFEKQLVLDAQHPQEFEFDMMSQETCVAKLENN